MLDVGCELGSGRVVLGWDGAMFVWLGLMGRRGRSKGLSWVVRAGGGFILIRFISLVVHRSRTSR